MDLEKVSIMRLQEAEQMSKLYYNLPPLLCYSGGKDSDVILDLTLKSGINFELQHSHTTADAPETVRHIRKKFYEIECKGFKCILNMPRYKGEPTSMWKLIATKKMPPTRLMRYCCSVLKETAGNGRLIITGVRRAESVKRRARGILETNTRNTKNRIILNNDNDDKRQIIEHCQMQGKTVSNIIVDWNNENIADYIKLKKLNINPLYRCGFNRIGCIGCPMAGLNGRRFEFKRYPKYRDMYIRAFDKMIEIRKQENKPTQWQTGLDVFHWWMEDGVLPGQETIDGEIW